MQTANTWLAPPSWRIFVIGVIGFACSACSVLEQSLPAGNPLSPQQRLIQPQMDAVVSDLIAELVTQQQSLLIANASDSAENGEVQGIPLPPLEVVLIYEQTLCAQPKMQRADLMAQLKSAADLPSRFQLLILASCAPDYTPAILAMALKQVRTARQWPPGYEAYWDLMERHHQALFRLENLYGNLKDRMDTTIEKLTEIEVQSEPWGGYP